MRATYTNEKDGKVRVVFEGNKEEFVQIIDALMVYPIEVVQNLGTYLNKAQCT